MYYQYKLAHFKGNMGHDATSDVGECLLGAISDKFRVGKKVPPPNFFCYLCILKTLSWHFGCE